MRMYIPTRWTDYKPIGNRIEGTRFIPFKVPLTKRVSDKANIHERLDDNILLENIPNLGIIIDLTNTTRYYNPNVFIIKGLEYRKLAIPGREIPCKEIVLRFSEIVKKFIAENIYNNKLIGVHCTHGVNRTGYLICHYMVSVMGIDPKKALKRFAIARGHQIERPNYISELYKQKPNTHVANVQNCSNSRKVANRHRASENTNVQDCSTSGKVRVRHSSSENTPKANWRSPTD